MITQKSNITQAKATQNTITMTSLDIASLTGKRHGDVIRDIRSMISAAEDDAELLHKLNQGLTELKDDRAYTSHFLLSKFAAELLAMGYSVVLRGRVLSRLYELESGQLPKTLPEALRLAADLAEKNELLAIERDHAIATKAQIGSKREATAMATAAKHKREAEKLKHELGRNARHATIIAVERATGLKFPKNAYVALRKWCKKNNTPSVDVVDDRYGSVKAWPAGAWLAEFDVDLSGLFAGEGAQ